MIILALSRSLPFKRHVTGVIGSENDVVFYNHADDIGVDVMQSADIALFHASSINSDIVYAMQNTACPNTPVGVASDHPTLREMLQMSNLNSRAYFDSYMSAADYRHMLQSLLNGQHWYVSELLKKALRNAEVVIDHREDVMAGLTRREREIASEVARGLSNKEIAALLGITERTVKAHLSNIFDKLGINDRVRLALRFSRRPASA